MSAPHLGDIVRYAVLVIVAGVIALFGMSLLRKYREQQALMAEMRSVLSESTYYRQFYADDAKRTLFKAMHLLHRAEAAGHDPREFVDDTLGVTTDSPLDRAGDRDSGPSRAETLASETLLANYENCRKLGLLDDEPALADLATGTPPKIPAGPAAGQPTSLRTIIDPELSPGIEKVLANLEIGPPRPPGAKLGDVEIAAARRLANDLEYAGIIDRAAFQRITDHYKALAK